jgi:uncharacterized protein (TIGR02594 family)
MTIPAQFKHIESPDAPRMVREAVKTFGVKEYPGSRDNPRILSWAREVGKSGSWYNRDSIPWCGLWMAVIAQRANKTVVHEYLRAQAWLKFGRRRNGPALLGDVLVFERGRPGSGKGHVGLYVGETEHYYYVLGGNQEDSVMVSRLEKRRLLQARYEYRIGQPRSAKRIRMGVYGGLTENEA